MVTNVLIVLSYNQEDFVSGCIKSIEDQLVRPDKVLWYDDCSTDNTVYILEKHLNETCSLKSLVNVIVNKENIGIYRNINQSMNSWGCDYIHYLACDDWLENSYFADYNDYCYRNNISADQPIIISSNHFKDFGETSKKIEYSEVVRNSSGVIRGTFTTRNLGISRELIKIMPKCKADIGMWADRLFELDMVLASKKIYHIEKAYHHYRVGVGVSSRGSVNEILFSFVSVNRFIIENYDKIILPKDLRYLKYCVSRDELLLGYDNIKIFKFMIQLLVNIKNGSKLKDLLLILYLHLKNNIMKLMYG
jgi:glycosyltransferase involved in cell wall biosynthesis